MIEISKGKVILESRPDFEFENLGVLNPACVEKDGLVHLFYRAVRQDKVSSIGYCQIKDDRIVYRADKAILFPEYDYEKQGVEDPRITFFEGKYYLLYTAYDGQSALVAYAVSSDLINWKKMGIISPQMSYDRAEDIFRNNDLDKRYGHFERWYRFSMGEKVKLWEKDSALFPKRINGKMTMIHRVLPGIQICFFDNFSDLNNDYWEKYLSNLSKYIIIDPKAKFESAYLGGGSVPIETDFGWLLIYHGVDIEDNQRIYSTGAMLLDKDNPQKVIGRLPYPLFFPKATWEKQGFVNNVVFPTGTNIKDDLLTIYYGAADLRIATKTLSLSELLKELTL